MMRPMQLQGHRRDSRPQHLWRRPLIAAVCAGLALGSAHAANADDVAVVLKLVKADGHASAKIAFDATSCRPCTPIHIDGYNADNAKETVVALRVPRMRTLELTFSGDPDAIERVRVEDGDVPFHYAQGRWVVQLAPLDRDAITAAEYSMHIVEPGMVLRLEHADPARRAGAYRSGAFPVRQRRAADTLEFAQREVVRRLGLGEQAVREGLGTIQIMGFDTNDPHGHRDDPPHIHMHLRWPQDTGTQIGHLYLDDHGLLVNNRMGIKGIERPPRDYGKGETATTIAPDGRPLYAHTITAEGWLQLGRPGQAPCLIQPLGDGGFDTGARIACPGLTPIPLTVRDDLTTGTVTVHTGDIEEIYRYDTDTGALTSPQDVPLPAPSVDTTRRATAR
ncbi:MULTISPECIES: hypothetical protein [unclassified Xanthomonas]|uniref:hypothetical protein n=1 Tax=Xanthomonas sp. LMG 9002 TaxID=1591158 RepID=UPI00136BDB6B|nr:hypothetical protein [Xanthomonas sp. LMG 9002]